MTFDEIAEDYTNKLREAARLDARIGYKSFSEATARDLSKTQVVSSLKTLDRELQTKWLREDRHLDAADKTAIIRRVAERLGVLPDRFEILLRAASNDNFLDLTQYWNDFYIRLQS